MPIFWRSRNCLETDVQLWHSHFNPHKLSDCMLLLGGLTRSSFRLVLTAFGVGGPKHVLRALGLDGDEDDDGRSRLHNLGVNVACHRSWQDPPSLLKQDIAATVYSSILIFYSPESESFFPLILYVKALRGTRIDTLF